MKKGCLYCFCAYINPGGFCFLSLNFPSLQLDHLPEKIMKTFAAIVILGLVAFAEGYEQCNPAPGEQICEKAPGETYCMKFHDKERTFEVF